MSANREDALKELRGPRLPFDAAVPVGPDPTEDLADETTSELGAAARLARSVVAATADVPAAPELATGENILRDRYVLETQLGAGGTAVIHRAVDLRRDANAVDGRRVAIKVLRPELRDRPHAVLRLQREFRQAQAAAHPGVVRVFDLDCDRGTWFIVMELLSGTTLGSVLRRAAPAGLPADEALRIVGAAADALAHAHAVGVVHGDVKPDNLFLTDSGELRLLDFGVAPELSGEPAEPVPAAATRVYASPEVLGGERPGPRDDVFSLACVAYEMLSGERPYGRRGAESDAGSVARPVRIAALDDPRWAALDAALSLDREARPSMADFVRALRGGERRSERPVVPTDVAPPAEAPVAAAPQAFILQTPAPPPRRGRLALFAVPAAGLALVAGILIGRMREPEVVTVTTAPAPVTLPPVAAVVPEPVPAAAAPPPREAPLPREAEAPRPEPVTGPPGLVYFDSPRMIVSKNAVVAAVPMRNLSKVRRAVTVNWRIVEGSARVDRDFAGPLAGTEAFVEGNSFRILYIPILQDPSATRDRKFTVEMTSASAGANLGPTPRIEVTILGGA